MMFYSFIHCIASSWKLWNVLHDALLLNTLYCRLLETLECITWCFTPLYIVLPVVGNFGMYCMMIYSLIHCIAGCWKLWNVLHDVLLLYTLYCRLLETLECITWCFTPLYIVLPVVGNFGMYYMMFYSFIHCIASSWKLWNVLHDVLLLYTLFCRLLETLECVTHALD
jgi:hypothetical protein